MKLKLLKTYSAFVAMLLFMCNSIQIGFAQVSLYEFTSSIGVYTPITGGVVYGNESNDDQRFVNPAAPEGSATINSGVGLPIGFDFEFNGLIYDRFGINTNGWISLGQSALTPSVILSTDNYTPLSQNGTIVPNHLRARIAGMGRDLNAQVGSELRSEIIGMAPNRTLVVQWTNYRKYSTTSTGDSYNFQIRLNETTNTVEVVYGTTTNNTTSNTIQVGLGGNTSGDFNNRLTTTDWTATSAGVANNSTCSINATVVPTNGLTYTWEMPACVTTLPSISLVTGNSATVTWTSTIGGPNWNIEWSSSPFTPGTGAEEGTATSSTGSQLISGLSPQTTYYVYIQSDCGAGEFGDWEVVTFTTTDEFSVTPYYEDFSVTTEWPTNDATVSNKWYIGSATGNPANSLYISNNNGVTWAYSGSATVAHAFKSITLPASSPNPYKLSFDWNGLGEGTWDYGKVWLVPLASNLPVNTLITTTNVPGAVQLGTNLVGATDWTAFSMNIPPAFMGTTFKLVFEWRNDGSVYNSPLAIDNIAIYYDEEVPPISETTTTPSCLTGTELVVVGTPSTNYTWYWQTTETGTSTDNDATTPWNVMENGTYYARAYNSFTDTWSDATSYVVTTIPAETAPPAPIAASNPACTPGTELVMIATPPVDVTYYWQGTSDISSSTANSTATPSFADVTGTYYVKAFNSATSCWSLPTGLLVTVDTEIPAAPTADPSQFDFCSGAATAEISVQYPSGPDSLFTTNSGTTTCGNGNMFDIITNGSALNIQGVSIKPGITGANTLRVYYKPGTYNGSQQIMGDWTLVGTYNFTGTLNVQQFIDIDDFSIPASSTYGIYLDFYSSYSSDNVSTSNADMTITTGLGHCSPFSSGNSPRKFNGTIYYEKQVSTDITWYDEATNGNVIGFTQQLEAIGTSVLPVATPGSYEFYAESSIGGCASLSRALVVVNINPVVAELIPTNVSCNNGNDGSFTLGTITCGVEPFTYSVDGGVTFGAIPTNLSVGTNNVIIQDANGDQSSSLIVVVGDAPAPTDLTEISITNSTAVIQWTAPGSEIQWNIEWGLPGFTPGNGEEIGSATSNDTVHTIIGLIGNTEYEVYVSADCGTGTVPGTWSVIDIWTECDPFDLPFTETFETTSGSIVCWLTEPIVGTGNWFLGVGSQDSGPVTTAFEGAQNAYYSGSTGTSSRLISPGMIVTGQDSVALTFALSQGVWVGDQNTTTVAIRNGLNGTWTNVKTYTENLSVWTVDTVVLQTTGFDTLFVAFVAIDDFGYNNSIDDVRVESCFIDPTADAAATVCSSEGSIDLTSIVTPAASGVWESDELNSLINGSDFNISLLAEGTYIVKHVASTACAYDTALVTITVTEPASAGIDGMLQPCRNQMIDLFGGLSGTVDFGGTWYAPNNAPMPSSYFQTGTLVGQQVYRYVVSNGVCDADTSEVIVNILNCNFIGVEEVNALENVSVSPNPTTETFKIEGIPGADYSFELLDVNGRVILSSRKITSTITTVDISTFENGVYLLRINGNDSERMVRVIKQ